MKKLNILIRVSGGKAPGKEIGYGHVFRSLNLALNFRDHRVLFLYNVFKQNLQDNWISAPRVCAYENVDITTVANKYVSTYPDIEQVFNQANLPMLFPGEEQQHMTSCWLTNFNEAADSLVYVPTETVYFGNRLHITEKTFKAIDRKSTRLNSSHT